MSRDAYRLTFRLALEDDFTREHVWSDDQAAVKRSREELELFIGQATEQRSGTVMVERQSGETTRSAQPLGLWKFDASTGFEWIGVVGGGGRADADAFGWPSARLMRSERPRDLRLVPRR